MNVDMLKCLVELSGGKPDGVDSDKFFEHFPNNAATLADLQFLRQEKYIYFVGPIDNLYGFDVTIKALKYFNWSL